jgi:hypothetical protein
MLLLLLLLLLPSTPPGEFLGSSLAQLEEGLRKLNVNEEVSGSMAGAFDAVVAAVLWWLQEPGAWHIIHSKAKRCTAKHSAAQQSTALCS